ncbi:MAG: glycine cleavage system aminomethyltransferase GcvT [Nitrospirae bacterium]|nr:glycine cleavage system aminomethyltransferase GcvT [Nitrospirota bacterium]MBI3594304.1 glycine cleavage system aminomethyltransferase GcvT [Nitrospirota bacterium]
MNRTPLFEIHKKLNGKLVEFGGWEMPLFYSGVVAEHKGVRTDVGLFDICHMGRLIVQGADAESFLQKTTVNNVALLVPGKAHYSLVCNLQGGVKDDIFIYKKGDSDFFICVNASNREKIFRWFLDQKGQSRVSIEDASQRLGMLALQGPKAPRLLEKILGKKFRPLKHAEFFEEEISGVSAMIARTGYTGERGYEFYYPASESEKLWALFMKMGQDEGIIPVGLGARDTLRLEMGYALYGHELGEDISPLEADLAKFVYFDKPFIGKESLQKMQEKELSRILIGFELKIKNVPRQHCRLFQGDQEIGEVTSGNLTPSVQKGIGMAFIQTSWAREGTEFSVLIRDKKIPAVVTKRPFYKKK